MRKKSFIALLVCIALVIGIIPASVFADPSSQTKNVNFFHEGRSGTAETRTCEVITEESTKLTDTGATRGWYVADNTEYLKISDRIVVEGDVKLVLTNTMPLQPLKGISVNKGNSLTIYRGSDIFNTIGIILIIDDVGQGNAGIGGDAGQANGAITICGGDSITAKGNGGAGIGTGANVDPSQQPDAVIIKGGTVSGSSYLRTAGGAGIGGGKGSNACGVRISGGTVTATGASYAAGIGGGRGGLCNMVQILGGEVTATGGDGGPGIGSGMLSESRHLNTVLIDISGGTVFAQAGQDSVDAKALMQADMDDNQATYSCGYGLPEKHRAYVTNGYGASATGVTLCTDYDDIVNYKWLKLVPCEEHKDEDGDSHCDYCKALLTYVRISYGFSSTDAELLIPTGDRIARPADPVREGYIFLGWDEYSYDPDTHTKERIGRFDFSEPVHDGRVYIIAAWEPVGKATICAGDVVFGAGIELQFRIEFSDYLKENSQNVKVVFTDTDTGKIIKETPISSPDAVEGDNLYFRVPVDLYNYRKYIAVKVVDENDEPVLLVHPNGTSAYDDNECWYSVAMYIRNVISAYDPSDPYDEMTLLAAYLQGYCEAVTRFFVYDDGTEFGRYPGIYNFEYSQDKIDKYGVVKTENQVEGCLGASLNVEFQYINTLRLTFKIDDTHPISDYSFTVDGQPAEAVKIGKGKYALYVKNIIAQDLVVPHTFTVTRNNTDESFTVKASSMSYALLASQFAESEHGRYLGKALYCFGEAADNYFNKQ